MNKNSTNHESADYVGVISGAYLMGLLESFANTRIVDPRRLPFDIESLQHTAWYPYHYLTETISLTEQLLPDSSSILFWAGVRFMELWYFHGPGSKMVFSGMDWVYGNENGEGYRSVAKGGTPEQIGWTKNISTNPKEGFALVENVMPLRAEYLRGIYYGGFLLFDDMAYFDAEIYSESNEPDLPHPRTVIKLVFRPKNKDIVDERFSTPAAKNKPRPMSLDEAEEALWRIKQAETLHRYREKYSRDLMALLSKALDELRSAKDQLQSSNESLAIESQYLREARAAADAAHKQLTEVAVERSKNEERNKLLQDMHDGFGSQLTSARLMAESGRIPASKFPQILEECMADLYLMADTLSNPGNTLADSLADLKFRTTQRMQRLPVTLQWHIALDTMSALSQQTILQVLRIVQETLNNALKHSGAKKITINARYDRAQETVTLEVLDDGLGIPVQATPGRGMTNMQSRATAIGAEFTVLPGCPGTMVRLSLSLGIRVDV